jgi:hypothetical protein
MYLCHCLGLAQRQNVLLKEISMLSTRIQQQIAMIDVLRAVIMIKEQQLQNELVSLFFWHQPGCKLALFRTFPDI